MSTLNATNLKNPSSGSNNIVLAADGSVTMSTLNASAMNYSSGLRCCALGSLVEGGYLFAKQGGLAWIVACSSRQVSRTWALRADAVTVAQASNACGDWFVPSRDDLTFGIDCKSFWDTISAAFYYSNTEVNANQAWFAAGNSNQIFAGTIGGNNPQNYKSAVSCVRAFRRVFY
jgi:hypothetical protein